MIWLAMDAQRKRELNVRLESSRLMSDMVQMYDKQNRRLWIALLACVACLAIMSGCMIWTVQNAQRIANETVANALEAVAEMEVVTEETTVTTQTVEGDSAVINNAEWEQYNDYASKIAGGE